MGGQSIAPAKRSRVDSKPIGKPVEHARRYMDRCSSVGWADMKKWGASCLASITVFMGYSPAKAFTDCIVTLNWIFTGDISGAGQNALYLDFTYTLSTVTQVSNTGNILLSSPAAANISAAAFTARATGQSNIALRFQNSGGGSADAVCGGPPGRSDLIGIFL
jgi:hypothetical protein